MSHKDKHKHGGGQKPKDETYKIIIDRRPYDWLKPVITGAEIKNLAGVDQNTFEAWQDVPGPEDIPVGDNQEIDLTGKGTERFFTGKKTTTEG
jgi:hypothetical protein